MTASANAIEIATWAAQAADSKKADNIRILDVSERLAITDCFIIASADNERQVNAIVDGVEEALLKHKVKPVRREGGKEGRWILIDFVDVVVHVQHADEREFYGLDSLWKDCPEISWGSAVDAVTAGDAVEAEATEG